MVGAGVHRLFCSHNDSGDCFISLMPFDLYMMQKVEFLAYYFLFGRMRMEEICTRQTTESEPVQMPPQTREDIASILGISDKDLIYYIIRYERETGKQLYEIYSVPKKNGGTREIMAPIKPLKRIQRKLADYLSSLYEPRNNVYGFVQNRGTKDGAIHHLRAKVVFNLDLQDFFGTVNFGRVRGMLMKPPYSFGENAATTVAQIACYKNKLPQGSPCSPVLANMVCSHLDTALIQFSKKHHLRYTRYADDITFSTFQTIDKFPKAAAYREEGKGVIVGKELERIIHKSGFKINENKVFIQNTFQRQIVTGVVVNKVLNVPREYFMLTRALLFRCEKDGIESAAKYYIGKAGKFYKVPDKVAQYSPEYLVEWFRYVLAGRISYIGYIKGRTDSKYLFLARKCNQVFGTEIFKGLPESVGFGELINRVLLIESHHEGNDCQGSAFYVEGIGIITCYHCLEYVIKHGVKANVFSINPDGSKRSLCQISNSDVVRYDKNRDYAVANCTHNQPINGFEIGSLNQNDYELKDIYLLGYPNYITGNTAKIMPSKITYRKNEYLGSELYVVSNVITHGMSGGPVLDSMYKVIGIIKGGLNTMDEELYDIESGFIPIEYVATRDTTG